MLISFWWKVGERKLCRKTLRYSISSSAHREVMVAQDGSGNALSQAGWIMTIKLDNDYCLVKVNFFKSFFKVRRQWVFSIILQFPKL